MSQHAQYWMDDELWDDLGGEGEEKSEEVSLIRITKLAAIRRAIGNFVNILTNRNDIPVHYSSGQLSYTDGEQVIIAADDNPDHFDSMVGLALHEASHILLTDFNFIRAVSQLDEKINTYYLDVEWEGTDIRMVGSNQLTTVTKQLVHPALNQLLPLDGTQDGQELYRTRARTMLKDLKTLMNVMEDRRIDRWVYQHCGGYRPYYEALYTRYFFTSDIAKNLKWNPQWRELTVENYINRLLFSFHPDANPDALPGLRKLIEMMDIKTIERVGVRSKLWKKTCRYEDTPVLWKEANLLYLQILRFAAMGTMNNEGASEGAQAMADEVMQVTGELPNLDPGMPMSPHAVEDADRTKSGKEKPRTFNAKRGDKQAEQARDMVNGKSKKKKATKAEVAAANAMEEANAKMVDIKGDGIPGGQCMVTRKMSESMFTQDWFIFRNHYSWQSEQDRMMKMFLAGKRMGQILVHRLQVRNDPVLTKNTRLPQGGLDRRLLAQLGMEITSVFQKSRVDTYKPAMLHLTIDASGSMHGRKWEKVMTVATAMAYVGTKMRNIDTVITIRGGNEMPVVCVVFDSRKDQFTAWRKWMPRIGPNGMTPEGLCYKATMELILESAATHDVYFINFSDGEPGFTVDLRPTNKRGNKKGRRRWYSYVEGETNTLSYTGETAERHTRAQIQNLKDHGVKVLSYYISDSTYGIDHAMKRFRRMYGQDAAWVNVENASEVLRTLNKLLLARS